MGNVERQEGFWWVRVLPEGEGKEWAAGCELKWRTAEVVVNIGHAFVSISREHHERRLDDPAIEWGSYLGRNPGDTDSEVLKRLDIDTRFT
jgi:hypothetical protein